MNRSFEPATFWRRLAVCLLAWVAPASLYGQTLPDMTAPFVPDPNAVTRYESGWRFPQAGWIVLHIEGSPYDRGRQHGKLLAREIVDYCRTIAKIRNSESPDKAWQDLRLFVNALFLRRFDNEYLREMQGIADGAAEEGAKLDGRLIDLIDIAVINADIEFGFLEAALLGTATGIDREDFPGRHGSPTKSRHRDRCSAFIATGPATADGKIVTGHITMTDLFNVKFFNVWLDLQPSAGHRIAFQTYPGGIQSGTDYYINQAGLIVSETTIEQTRFNPQGEMLASRIRRAIQYSDSIDSCAEILKSSSNGLYTNEWLLGDIKTNEIAMFELGTEHSRMWRSSRNEWVGGTTGFYWGCNNGKDLNVFKETVADLGAKPANLVLRPHLRDEAWIKLFNLRQGKINEAFGFEAFSTPPIVAFPSCDAKFTTAAMAKDLKTWAIFGPPLGHTRTASESDRDALPSVQPQVAHEWTLIDVKGVSVPPARPESKSNKLIVDLDPFPKKEDALHVEFKSKHPFAWRGTLFPKSDADLWLAAAFAEFENVVSLENAIAFHITDSDSQSTTSSDDDDDSTSSEAQEGRDLADLALFQHASRWLTAVRRTGRDIPFAETRPDIAHADWYRIAAGKGVMLLATLRKQLGTKPFAQCLDEFGKAHAGQQVSAEEFRAHLVKSTNPDAVAIFDQWISEDVASKFKSQNPWTIFSHEVEPDRVIIIYGTSHDQSAQKEAANHLRTEIARRFANFLPNAISDKDVTDEQLSSHYLLLVGRPSTNRISARCVEKSTTFPVGFESQSFRINDEIYAHSDTWVVAAGENPFNPRYSVVIFGGLNAASTWRSVRNLPDPDDPNPQIILSVAGKRTRTFCTTKLLPK